MEKLKVKIKKIEIDWNKVRLKLKSFLSKVLCKIRKLFSEKAFSKGQMIIFCIIIIYGTFLYKNIVEFMSFLVVTLIGWLSGHIGLKHVKAVLEKAERVINNPNIPIDRKYVEAVGAVHTSCDYLGRVMDQYNLKQGTAPYLRDLKKQKEVK